MAVMSGVPKRIPPSFRFIARKTKGGRQGEIFVCCSTGKNKDPTSLFVFFLASIELGWSQKPPPPPPLPSTSKSSIRFFSAAWQFDFVCSLPCCCCSDLLIFLPFDFPLSFLFNFPLRWVRFLNTEKNGKMSSRTILFQWRFQRAMKVPPPLRCLFSFLPPRIDTQSSGVAPRNSKKKSRVTLTNRDCL